MLLGIGGACIGSFRESSLGLGGFSGFDLGSVVLAVGGARILL